MVGVGLDEAAFKVGVNDACGLWGLCTVGNGPGADFLHAGGEVGNEAEQLVGRVDKAVETGFGEAHVGEELGTFGRLKERDFGFHGAADTHHLCAFLGGALLDGGDPLVAVFKTVLVDVGHVEDRFYRDEMQVVGGCFLVVGELDRTGRLAVAKGGEQLGEGFGFGLDLVVGGVFDGLLDLCPALFGGFKVGQQQLGVDDVHVVQGIDAAGDVDDIGIVEAADDVADSVGGANVAEELVAQAFALTCAFDQSGDVDELHGGGHGAVGLDEAGDAVEPLVGHGDHADVGIDGAERVVGRLRFCCGEGIEDGAFADIRQSDDPAIQGHGVSGSFKNLMNASGSAIVPAS